MIKISKRDVGEVFLGKMGWIKSWQKKFPETTKCKSCGGKCRIGFVYYEMLNKKNYVSGLHHNNENDKYWPHDAVAVATYFLRKNVWNQHLSITRHNLKGKVIK